MGSMVPPLPPSLNTTYLNMSLTELQSKIQQVNETLNSLQQEVAETVVLSADVWRITASVFVFLMQASAQHLA